MNIPAKKFHNLLSRHKNVTAFLFFSILALIFFWPALVKGQTLLAFDYVAQFYPSRAFYKESLLSGEFPLWCPYPSAGTFFATNLQNSCFYPLTACFVLFPVTHGFSLYAALHLALFAFFIYLLAKEYGLSFGGALMAGIVAFAAGMPLSELEFPELLGGLTWCPMILLCFFRLLKDTCLLNTLLLAFSCSMLVLAGSPYSVIYSVISMLVIGVAFAFQQRLRIKEILLKIGHAMAAAIITFLLCSPVLVPMFKLYRDARVYGREGVLPKIFSMRLIDWLPALAPKVLGYEDNFKCFYLGLLPLLLIALLACWFVYDRVTSKKTDAPDGMRPLRNTAITFFILACIGFVASFGDYISLNHLMDLIPLLARSNKWPSWMGFLYIIGACMLAGVSFDVLVKMRRSKGFRQASLPLLVVGFCIAIGLMIFSGAAATCVEKIRGAYWQFMHSPYFMAEIFNLSHYPATQVVMRFAAFLLAGALLLGISIYTRLKPAYILIILACCLLADKAMFFSTRAISHTSKVDIYNEKPKLVVDMQNQTPPGMLYRVYIPKILDPISLTALFSRRVEDYQMKRSWLMSGVATQYHISTNDNMTSFRDGAFDYVVTPWIESLKGAQKDYALGLWNFKYILDASLTKDMKLTINLRQNPYFQPRAWLSYASYPVETLQENLALMTNTSIKHREIAFLVQPGQQNKALRGQPGTADVDSISYTNNTVTITATAAKPAILYLSDAYESGWKACVDGVQTAVFRANINGRAVEIPEGKHTIVFKYSPLSFWVGLWIGAISWILFLLSLAIAWRRRHLAVNEPQAITRDI